jgi:uncharacterized protein (UPF0548 family)
MWRITPVHRWEMTGSAAQDGPPSLPPGTDRAELQGPEDGTGPLVHRLYRTRIEATRISPEELIGRVSQDLNRVAPTEFASFHKLRGDSERMAVGDEYVVRMPGPWDGPVRVIDVGPRSFRLATLTGHLEAGQIEFRTSSDHRSLAFTIESWARSGDRLSDALYSHLRMAKEVQLHMWTSVLERVVRLSGGVMTGGIDVITRPVWAEGPDVSTGTGPVHRRARRRLAELERTPLNFDPAEAEQLSPEDGWHHDDMIEKLPHEPSGPPVAGGSWETARELMDRYQVADPATVRATYRRDAPLHGRTMLLEIRFVGLRLPMGVRVGDVYDDSREVDGRPACVFGWSYGTLEGHFEQGRMHYEVWKWLDTGDVEFRLRAVSRTAASGPLLLRLGFRLIGRRRQIMFYRQVCRRMRRLTEAQLELATAGRLSSAPTA